MMKFLSLLYIYEFIWLGALARGSPAAGLHATGLDEDGENESLANPSRRSSQPVITRKLDSLTKNNLKF